MMTCLASTACHAAAGAGASSPGKISKNGGAKRVVVVGAMGGKNGSTGRAAAIAGKRVIVGGRGASASVTPALRCGGARSETATAEARGMRRRRRRGDETTRRAARGGRQKNSWFQQAEENNAAYNADAAEEAAAAAKEKNKEEEIDPEPAAATAAAEPEAPQFKSSLFDDAASASAFARAAAAAGDPSPPPVQDDEVAPDSPPPITKDDFIAPTFNWDAVKDRSPSSSSFSSSSSFDDIPETLAAQRQSAAVAVVPPPAFVPAASPSPTSLAALAPAPERQAEQVRSFLYPGEDQLPDDVNMSIWDHLEELRERALISAGAVTALVLLCFFFAKDLVLFLEHPVAEEGVRFLQLGPGEYFFTTVKVAGYCGLLLGAPVVLYEAIAYVLPGLTRDERKFLGPIVLGSSVLFYAGIGFAYAVLTPAALKFFIGYANEAVESLWSIDQYFEFVLVLLFSTGLSFQVPVIQLLLGQTGIVSSQQMLSVWRYVVVGSVVAAAVLTPSTDPFTQMLLAVPLMSLYLGGAALVGVVEKGRDDQIEA